MEAVGVAVLGAGPAGLTAAHVLARRGVTGIVLEAGAQVGGIARTVEHDGFRFDLGGHRFFTKVPAIQALWQETLGDDFLVRPRLSRIYYRGEYFAYPLRPEDVLRRLGLVETLRCSGSWLRSRTRRRGTPATFEDWVTDRFGHRLYDVFFREYTEKVWGIPGSEIESEWAVQRIRDLSLWSALTSALGVRRHQVVSLIDQFHYPRFGPGQMWEAFAERVRCEGVDVRLGTRATRLIHDGRCVTDVIFADAGGGDRLAVDGVVSSIPLSELVLALDPVPPADVIAAAHRLRYRDLLLVGLISTDPAPFPDNWIYLHDPGIRAGRVQNFGAWSSGMTQPGCTSLGVEYFCFDGDETWSLGDVALIARATHELASIGLLDPDHIVDGVVIRVPKAYPMYDRAYAEAVSRIRAYLATLTNLQTVGRNGLHRYNNQDHSMLTGALGALNLVDGSDHDVWSVNTDASYLEEGSLELLALGAEVLV